MYRRSPAARGPWPSWAGCSDPARLSRSWTRTWTRTWTRPRVRGCYQAAVLAAGLGPPVAECQGVCFRVHSSPSRKRLTLVTVSSWRGWLLCTSLLYSSQDGLTPSRRPGVAQSRPVSVPSRAEPGRTRSGLGMPFCCREACSRRLPVPSRRPGAARPRGRSWAALDATAGRLRQAPPTGGRVVAPREVDGMVRPPIPETCPPGEGARRCGFAPSSC